MALALNLEGKVILVCGVARGGIGGATVRQLAAAGATIFAVDYQQSILDETEATIAAGGTPYGGMVADVTDAAQSDAIVPALLKRFGRVDGVANVAGGTRDHEWMKLEETPTAIFRDVLNFNLEYVFRICRDAAAHMIGSGTAGSLVNVSSISGLASAPFHGPYGAAKSGIAALTRTMAVEWRQHGIRANSVAPGAVATDRVTARASWGQNPTTNDQTANLTSVDALGNAITFLLSDLASGISGQNLVVDSGLSANFCAGSVEQMSRSIRKNEE